MLSPNVATIPWLLYICIPGIISLIEAFNSIKNCSPLRVIASFNSSLNVVNLCSLTRNVSSCSEDKGGDTENSDICESEFESFGPNELKTFSSMF